MPSQNNQELVQAFMQAQAQQQAAQQAAAQQQAQQQAQQNQKVKHSRTLAKSLVYGSLGAGLATTCGLLFGTGLSLTTTLLAGGAIAIGLSTLIPLSLVLVRKIAQRRHFNKLARDQKIATRKAFFKKMGYELPAEPVWHNRFANWITSRFSKEKRQNYAAKKAEYKQNKKEYNFGKKAIEKTPWAFANINSDLINSNGSKNVKELVMINTKPVVRKDEKTGKKTTYYQVASVYGKDGKKFHLIEESKLFKIDPKTKLSNCSFLEDSDLEIQKRIEDGLLLDNGYNNSRTTGKKAQARRTTKSRKPKKEDIKQSSTKQLTDKERALAILELHHKTDIPEYEKLPKNLKLYKNLDKLIKANGQNKIAQGADLDKKYREALLADECLLNPYDYPNAYDKDGKMVFGLENNKLVPIDKIPAEFRPSHSQQEVGNKAETKKEGIKSFTTTKPASPTPDQMQQSWLKILALVMPELIKLVSNNPEILQQALQSQSNNAELVKIANEILKVNPDKIDASIVSQAKKNLVGPHSLSEEEKQEKEKSSKKKH